MSQGPVAEDAVSASVLQGAILTTMLATRNFSGKLIRGQRSGWRPQGSSLPVRLAGHDLCTAGLCFSSWSLKEIYQSAASFTHS